MVVFNKIKIIENKKWKTIFCTRYKNFELLIMSFGLCGIPSIIQNYINEILYKYLKLFCSADIDNMFIYNKTKKEHMKQVPQIFQK